MTSVNNQQRVCPKCFFLYECEVKFTAWEHFSLPITIFFQIALRCIFRCLLGFTERVGRYRKESEVQKESF